MFDDDPGIYFGFIFGLIIGAYLGYALPILLF